MPTEWLERLAETPHVEIRMAVAQHPQVPGNVLARLLDDDQVFGRTEPDTSKPWDQRPLWPYGVLNKRVWESDADWQALAGVSNPAAKSVLAYQDGAPDRVLRQPSPRTSQRKCETACSSTDACRELLCGA